jgi:hypothetical protein
MKEETERGKKKRIQINIKLDDDLYRRLQAGCAISQHGEGQLCRLLVEWSLPFYELTRSMEKLQKVAAADILHHQELLAIEGEPPGSHRAKKKRGKTRDEQRGHGNNQGGDQAGG